MYGSRLGDRDAEIVSLHIACGWEMDRGANPRSFLHILGRRLSELELA